MGKQSARASSRISKLGGLGASLAALLVSACGQTNHGGAANGGLVVPAQNNAIPSTSGTGAPSPTGSSGLTGTGTAGSGTWCNALGVIRNTCQQCHGTQRQFGAPMSMVTYADMVAPAVTDRTKKVYELVKVRIHDSVKPMPPAGITALTPAAMGVLDSWIAAGAQAGSDPTCSATTTAGTAGAGGVQTPPTAAGTGGAAAPATTGTGGTTSATTPTTTADDWPADCEMHYKFLANASGGKYSVPAGAEQHPSFNFPAPWTGAVQAVKFKAVLDNTQVLHHWILYAADGAFLAGWAPGNDAGNVPPDVGLYLPSGSGNQLRLDVHYNNVGGTTAQQDSSGVELCVVSTPAKMRPHTATTFGFTASATAPAHMMVDNAATCTVTASMGPVHLIGQSPHMHKLGVHAKFELTRADGSHVVIHDMPFDFNEQRAYAIMPDLVLNTGDMITTTCSYNNTTDANVTFGQNTEDEMCFNFSTYWPKGGLSCPSGGLGGFPAH
jgi:hypothetical protein